MPLPKPELETLIQGIQALNFSANQAMAEALKVQALTDLAELALVVLLVGMILGAGVGIVLFVVRFQQAEQQRRMGMIQAPGEFWGRQAEEEGMVFRDWGW